MKIPTPQYVVFYNGEKKVPDKKYLHLSDAFEVPVKDGEYEWTAVMYNINEGHNQKLMEGCRALREYASYVAMVRSEYEKHHNLRQAIDTALEEAIRRNYLDGFFEEYKEEVFMTTLTEFDIEQYEKDLRSEGIEIGYAEGREEGREEGRAEGRVDVNQETIKKLMTVMGMSFEEACDFQSIPETERNWYKEKI